MWAGGERLADKAANQYRLIGVTRPVDSCHDFSLTHTHIHTLNSSIRSHVEENDSLYIFS